MPSLAAQFEAVVQAFPDRLLALVIVGFPEVAARLERAGCLVFEDPRRAVRAVAALVAFGRTFAMPAFASASLPAPIPPAGRGTLAEVASKAVLAQAGVPVVADALVTSSRDAAAAAARLGFPVVLKVVSPNIPHKSDIGGVVLGVESAEAAAAAYDRIMARVSAAAPAARIAGVLVSPQVGDAVEMILGTVRDEVFGPTVLLGFGGVFAEILSDTVLRLAPVSLDDARDMVAALKGASLLNGARGRASADVEALARAVSALSGFAAANAGWLASVDVNPLLVRPRGQGVVAVDALVVANGGEERP
jgi:succinyl-CoA synthetase beta subunit